LRWKEKRRKPAKEKILPVELAPSLEGVEGSENWDSGSQRRGW
jgi:hypothetical protein